ncbi:Rieske 2Fe-2S domain-containing protein [Ovoidimarina sediminis]|uniref:Rieske 2Fe-2S domain-containing protein n=1 Tax=Ovoidimarina sediminis TaxID=3079856 RepID=UPI00290E8EC2|nr:Rieske 2Fe-2S domain-containing protein [Rhodophyticola sp. MJ-SS7]MDU8943757.1 ferric reductase-like transmembrane domain-containing protein [Rhodophyticola sp. MJ-SS7]
MSVKYIPVQWNRFKWGYDAALVAGTGLFLWVFVDLAPGILSHERPITPQIHNARAFGACAFLMMTVILCTGPLARLDRRFLPLLYNRRHFGVLTAVVAVSHAYFILNWYFAFSPVDQFEAVLSSNTSFGQMAGFPFEALGVFALLSLLVLAATSHDFWMKFLTPPLWKALHYLIYPAYVGVVGHVMLGTLLDQDHQGFTVIVIGSAALVAGLHLAAGLKERANPPAAAAWVPLCPAGEIEDGRARIALLPNGDRVAVFRDGDRLSAIANACAHQNGPLGEGRIVDCLVTCPWHGFQYNVTDGRSPAPFTETIPTYGLKLENGVVFVNPEANPPGTYVEPVVAPVREDNA